MKNIFSSRPFAQLMIAVFLLIGACSNPTPAPIIPEENIYDACAPDVSSSSFDILSWNIEEFPIRETTTAEVADIILASDVDLVAFQEVSSASALDALLILMPGWEGKMLSSGNLNLGYLYKTEEVTISDLTTLYEDLWSPFPRPPVVTVATHTSGIVTTLINLHLKCCGGATNVARRTEASTLLQQYIETEKPNDPVIIIGDFND